MGIAGFLLRGLVLTIVEEMGCAQSTDPTSIP